MGRLFQCALQMSRKKASMVHNVARSPIGSRESLPQRALRLLMLTGMFFFAITLLAAAAAHTAAGHRVQRLQPLGPLGNPASAGGHHDDLEREWRTSASRRHFPFVLSHCRVHTHTHTHTVTSARALARARQPTHGKRGKCRGGEVVKIIRIVKTSRHS